MFWGTVALEIFHKIEEDKKKVILNDILKIFLKNFENFILYIGMLVVDNILI